MNFLWPVMAVAVALVTGLWLRRLHARLAGQDEQIRQMAREIRELRSDMGGLLAGARGLGERLGQFEQQLRHQAERQDQLELRHTGERPYQQAIRMVQRGASASDLVDAFGMSRSEADLVVMMHQLDKAV